MIPRAVHFQRQVFTKEFAAFRFKQGADVAGNIGSERRSGFAVIIGQKRHSATDPVLSVGGQTDVCGKVRQRAFAIDVQCDRWLARQPEQRSRDAVFTFFQRHIQRQYARRVIETAFDPKCTAGTVKPLRGDRYVARAFRKLRRALDAEDGDLTKDRFAQFNTFRCDTTDLHANGQFW